MLSESQKQLLIKATWRHHLPRAAKAVATLSDEQIESRTGIPAKPIRVMAQRYLKSLKKAADVPQPVPVTAEEPALDLTEVVKDPPEEVSEPAPVTYDELNAMNKKALKALAKKSGLKVSGTSADLFNRLAEFFGLVE